MCDLQLRGGIRPNDLTWEPFVQYFVSIAVFAVRFKWSRVQVRFFCFTSSKTTHSGDEPQI